MMVTKRGPLPRIQYTKEEKSRCSPILDAFKELNKVFHRYPYYIKIRKSTIIGAGKGAFSTCAIPKGTRLGYYAGKCYSPGKEPNTAYLLEISYNGRPYVIMDAAPPRQSNWTRFINCPEKSKHANVIFRQYGKIMYILASRDIPAGEEMFLWYGKAYIDSMLKKYFKGLKPKSKKYIKKLECLRLNK